MSQPVRIDPPAEASAIFPHARAHRRVVPEDLLLVLTYRCNSRCVMCGIWEGDQSGKGELTPEEYRRILPDTLRDINLTGGEVFLRNDLPEVLRDPLRYMVERGKHLLRNPGTIPGKTRDYATYDLIHLYNEVMDTVPIGRAAVDRIMSALSSPASRALRLKRHISLLVSDCGSGCTGHVLQGTYQSPILVQHQPAAGNTRYLDVVVRRFND